MSRVRLVSPKMKYDDVSIFFCVNSGQKRTKLFGIDLVKIYSVFSSFISQPRAQKYSSNITNQTRTLRYSTRKLVSLINIFLKNLISEDLCIIKRKIQFPLL